MGLLQRNPIYRVNGLAEDGLNASYTYDPKRRVWLVYLGEGAEGFAFQREDARELAERLLREHDERLIDEAFEYVRWACEVWPGLRKQQYEDIVMKHCKGACLQAVRDVLKRGTLD